MSFLDHNNDVKTIITKHLINDKTINKTFLTRPDDDLQQILFAEVKEMEMSVFEIQDYLIIINLMMRSNLQNKIITKFIR